MKNLWMKEAINRCMYQQATVKTQAAKNYWERRAEELEYLMYVDGTKLDRGGDDASN